MDISSFFASIRAHFWILILTGLLAGALAFGISSALPKQYEAEAQVLVGSLADPTLDQLLAHQQLAQTYAQLATTTPVLRRVIDDLGLDETTQELAERIDIRVPTGLSIITVTATASTPAEAAALANAMATEIVELSDTPGTSTTGLATIVQRAVPPTTPSSPQVVLNTMIAATLGVAVGLTIALVIDQRRRGRRPEGSPSPEG